MKEGPILMNGAMVRAVLDGSKTQTRRVVKLQRLAGNHFSGGAAGVEFDGFRIPREGGPSPARFSAEAAGGGAYISEEIHCPHGQPGDRLWVRETWYCDHFEVQKGPYMEVPEARDLLVYRADGEHPYEAEQPIWRPSIHMPHWASRILLEIVSVRVERLNDCSDADARAEGTPGGHGVIPSYNYNATPSEHYSHMWEAINGAGSWAANPWVWVIEFERVAP
ncbi:hypothetical protein [Janthinobacterium sp. AD80]|uniref:hypothetical protein n=1 Tax=Janthinobacterium sp. AD80 TaxID=1528773 RepID=UPI000C81AA66|nr:hypothetical protein [Janthinobacterium sp. AD80]PMQ16747.1 hypothetical protein JaAD80_08740 [Janthinobacterium sp. AD80]